MITGRLERSRINSATLCSYHCNAPSRLAFRSILSNLIQTATQLNKCILGGAGTRNSLVWRKHDPLWQALRRKCAGDRITFISLKILKTRRWLRWVLPVYALCHIYVLRAKLQPNLAWSLALLAAYGQEFSALDRSYQLGWYWSKPGPPA